MEVESIAMATSLLMNAMIMTIGPLVEFASCCFCPFKFPAPSQKSYTTVIFLLGLEMIWCIAILLR